MRSIQRQGYCFAYSRERTTKDRSRNNCPMSPLRAGKGWARGETKQSVISRTIIGRISYFSCHGFGKFGHKITATKNLEFLRSLRGLLRVSSSFLWPMPRQSLQAPSHAHERPADPFSAVALVRYVADAVFE